MDNNAPVTIITGASSGIGQATALELARRGHRVVLAARRAERIEELAKTIARDGGTALPVTCDVASRAQVDALFHATMDRFGRVDVLINNAGIMPLSPMIRCRVDDWDDCIDVNIKGVLYAIAAALPIMLRQKEGHIINISSVAGRKLFPGAAVYCATKHAVHAISEGLREELAQQAKDDDGNRIRVTIIAPGVVRTELPESIRDEKTRLISRGYYDSFEEPLLAEDIAAAIAYALDAPRHVNVNEILIRPTAQLR